MTRAAGANKRGSCFAALVLCTLGWPSQVDAAEPSPASSAQVRVSDGQSVGAAAPSSSSTATPASSSPPVPLAELLQGESKNDYEAGRLLFDSADYTRALLMFQNAYQLAGDPRLLWNEAACERNLHRYVKATNLVRRLLASDSAVISPDLASRARAFLAAAEPLSAPLEIESNQPSAEVYVDDELLGTPELASGARVDLGTHRIEVKARGFQPFTQTLTVGSSAKVHLTVVLRALSVPMPARDVAAKRDDRAPRALPTWLWVAGGGVVLLGIATAGYFAFKPAKASGPVPGSIATLHF